MTKVLDIGQDYFAKLYNLPMCDAPADAELLWVDLETTGLYVVEDEVLEVGGILTNRYGQVCYGINAFHAMVHLPKLTLQNVCNPIAYEMHVRSGLVDAVTDNTDERLYRYISNQTDGMKRPTDQISEDMLAWLKSTGVDGKSLQLAGNSVGFDQKFFDRDFRSVYDWLFYRVRDVSTMKSLDVDFSIGEFYAKRGPNMKVHRSLPDIADSIHEYRYYLTKMGAVGGSNGAA